MSGNSYDLTMMRAKKSSKRLTTMVGIVLLVVLFTSFPCCAVSDPPVVSNILDQTIAEGGTQSHGPPERGSRLPAMGAGT